MKVNEIFFSPTGTSRRVAHTIAQAIAGNSPAPEGTPTEAPVTFDATQKAVTDIELPAEDVAVVAAPVYGGHVAPLALERLKVLRGNGTAAVAVAVYGNRAFDKAVVELARFLSTQGFRIAAVAGFVGEHSYSTDATPIAAGRPDMDDLGVANALGKAVSRKLAAPGWKEVSARRLKCPPSGWLNVMRFVGFALRYMRHPEKFSATPVPQVDANLCTHCGTCAANCPAGAIEPGNETVTDPERCIKCCACVKDCPEHARTFVTPFAAVLSKDFARRKPPVYLY